MTVDEQAEMFGSLAMSSPDAVVAVDLGGTVVWANPVAADMFGWSRGELLGRPFTALLADEAGPWVGATLERALVDGRTGPFATTGIRRDGDAFDLSVSTGVRRDARGRPLGTSMTLREVTPEIQAQRALRDSEARYRAIAETAQEGILAVSPDGEILFANERLTELLGMSMDEVYALGGTGLFAPAKAAQAARRLAARGRGAGPERSDFAYRHPAGGNRLLHVSASALTAADGSVLGSLAMVVDVTDQRSAEQALRRQALHDALTGLPNRLLFLDRLNTAAARQERSEGTGVAVLFLDVDHFKLVNDTYGHQAGDHLLVEVAARVEQAVRGTDTVARLGGDEFAVICEGADSGVAALVASRIQEGLEEPVTLDGESLQVSMSIGVALSPPYDAADLLRLADTAMYQTKATSRGRVVTYDEGLADDAARRLGVTRALREAIAEGSVPMSFEPVVELATRRVAGVTPVIGWEHPTLGPVRAGEALRAADNAGLRPELDLALLRAAARELAERRDAGSVAGDVLLCIHVAARTAHDHELGARWKDVVAESGLPARCLMLEISHDAVVDDLDGLRAVLLDLGRLGVRPAVQIDRSVVQGVTDLPAAARSIRAAAETARTIGAVTSAVGVATEAEARVLLELGCELGRGPLWGSAGGRAGQRGR